MMLLIPRQAGKNAAGRSGMVSPSKPLQGFLGNGFLNIRRPLALCYFHTEQIVTGLELPPLHRSNNDHPHVFVHGGKQFLRHPDCAESNVRLSSVKNWNLGLPLRAARDVMMCHSYNVVVQGGMKGDKPIDTLYNSNCDLIEKLNENDCDMASRDAHYPIYNEQSRVKEGSYATSGSKQSSTSRDSKLAQFIDYQAPSVYQQSDQQPLSNDGPSSREFNTRSHDMMHPLPEVLTLVSACSYLCEHMKYHFGRTMVVLCVCGGNSWEELNNLINLLVSGFEIPLCTDLVTPGL